MIKKCFKLNTCFIEVLKNSSALHTFDQKWIAGNPNRHASATSINCNPIPIKSNTTSSAVNMTKSITVPKPKCNRKERGDAESYNLDLVENETIVSETPVQTELFEVKGPNESAYLIEVQAKDLEEVKRELMILKGDYFRFDKTIIELFTIKCILKVETPFKSTSEKDQVRLSKIHAISSGCEEVYRGEGKFFFVSPVDRTTRAKRILQKFGYTFLEILYRFQPREKISLDDRFREVCNEFVTAVERLPRVISVTHNL